MIAYDKWKQLTSSNILHIYGLLWALLHMLRLVLTWMLLNLDYKIQNTYMCIMDMHLFVEYYLILYLIRWMSCKNIKDGVDFVIHLEFLYEVDFGKKKMRW